VRIRERAARVAGRQAHIRLYSRGHA